MLAWGIPKQACPDGWHRVLERVLVRVSYDYSYCIVAVPYRLVSYSYGYKRELIAAMLVNPADRYGVGIKSPSDLVSH